MLIKTLALNSNLLLTLTSFDYSSGLFMNETNGEKLTTILEYENLVKEVSKKKEVLIDLYSLFVRS